MVSSTLRGQDCDTGAALSVGEASGLAGEVAVELRGGSLCEVTGFSMAIGYDAGRLRFLRAIPGPFLENHAGPVLFFSARGRNSQGFLTLFAAFNLTAPPTPIPENSTLATLFYRIVPGVPSGTVILRNRHRRFGSPPIANIFTTQRGAIVPQLQDGSITISNCGGAASILVGSATAPSGEVSVELRGGSFCEVTGFSLAIGHDASRVQFLSAEPGPLLENHAGSDLVFLAEENSDEGFMSLRVAFDESEPLTVPPVSIPENSLLATLLYRIRTGAGPGTIVLRNEDSAFGDPPIRNAFTTSESVIEPMLEDGSITIVAIVEEVFPFTRGDADADGDLDFMDAVIMVSYRVPGALQPPCFKAADADDNGAVNLADALYMLNFLLQRGPAPPAPFMECGLDETADTLSCQSYPACP